MKKLMLLVAAAVGYVLGARAGRERYEQITGRIDKVKHDPRVQQQTQAAVDAARRHAPVVADKLTSAVSATTAKVTGSNSSGASVDDLNPDSISRQDHPYPQGDLP